MGCKPELALPVPSLRPSPQVSSWTEARSEGLGDITISWTFWTLVPCKAKTPGIYRTFPMAKTAGLPIVSLLHSSKLSPHAQLLCSYVRPRLSNSSGQHSQDRSGRWNFLGLACFSPPQSFLLEGKWTWWELPGNIWTRARPGMVEKQQWAWVSDGPTKQSHCISSDLLTKKLTAISLELLLFGISVNLQTLNNVCHNDLRSSSEAFPDSGILKHASKTTLSPKETPKSFVSGNCNKIYSLTEHIFPLNQESEAVLIYNSV